MTVKRILVMSLDRKETHEFCAILSGQHYEAVPLHSLKDLMSSLGKDPVMAILIDLDSEGIENRTIRDIAVSRPGTPILGMSKKAFHPELKDAICYLLYACLKKPVDPEELFYWLKCIQENASSN